jgi:hypothetical protein
MKLVKYEVDEDTITDVCAFNSNNIVIYYLQSKLRESFYGEDNIIDC